MRWFVAGVAAFLLTAFLLVAALEVSVFDDPRPALAGGGAGAAAVGVGLLVADALLPVPASLVMISLGALFGPVTGALLSLAGRFGMAVVGLWVGARARPLLARAVPEWERRYAAGLVERWGALAIIVSRPVPLLAESVTILAGAAGIDRRRALAAAFLGSIPEAVAYAATGALAATTGNAIAVFVAFLALATLFRLVEWRQRTRSQTTSATSATSSAASGT